MIAVLRGSQQQRTKALEHIIAGYWKPVYKYLRTIPGFSQGGMDNHPGLLLDDS